MANRNLLHKSKLEEFKKFLEANDIQWRDTGADYQVMQVRMKLDSLKVWIPVYEKLTGDHYSIQQELLPMVREFIKQSKEDQQ